MQLTACLGMMVDALWLKSLFIFKGKEGGRIEREREFKIFPKEAEYTVHEKAWTNIEIRLLWIENCLKLWVDKQDLWSLGEVHGGCWCP